jgi:hypothetical protein
MSPPLNIPPSKPPPLPNDLSEGETRAGTPAAPAGAPAGLGRGGWILILSMLLMLAVSVHLAIRSWNGSGAMGEVNPVSSGGMVALLLGATGAVLLGGGLMLLVFQSARSGHDQAVHDEVQRRTPDAQDVQPD